MARFIDELKRTHDCGALRASDIGKEVVLFGWVPIDATTAALIFIDLRDREGITQVVFDPDASRDAHELAEQLRGEWVIGIRGKVRSRGEQFSKKENKIVSAANPNLATGEIEIEVLEATIFNKAETPPFEIDDKIDTREEVRLEHRYLDLRRAPLQQALRMRHAMNQATRSYLRAAGLPRARDAVPGEVHARRRAQLPGARAPERRASSTRSPRARSSSSSSSWWRASTATSRSCVLPRRGPARSIGSPSSRRSTSRCRFVNQDDVFRIVEGLVFAIWKAALGIDLHELYPSGRFPQLPLRRVDARLRQRQAGPALRA